MAEDRSTEGMDADERKRCGIDIDVPKLKAGLRELSEAFVKGRQREYGMRIPAEPYRDGDLVCGAAYRLIGRLEGELAAAEQHVKILREQILQHAETCKESAFPLGYPAVNSEHPALAPHDPPCSCGACAPEPRGDLRHFADVQINAMCGWAETLAQKAGWTRENAGAFWASYDAARTVAKRIAGSPHGASGNLGAVRAWFSAWESQLPPPSRPLLRQALDSPGEPSVKPAPYTSHREALQDIVDAYVARSELFTNDADCAANLADRARAGLRLSPEPGGDPSDEECRRIDRAYYDGARQAQAIAHQSLEAMDAWIQGGCGGRGPVVSPSTKVDKP